MKQPLKIQDSTLFWRKNAALHFDFFVSLKFKFFIETKESVFKNIDTQIFIKKLLILN